MVSASRSVRAQAPSGSRSAAKDSRHHLFDALQDRGVWYGLVPLMMGLGTFIRESVWKHLVNGFSPDGSEKLVQNAGDKHRQAFWHFVFSAPKAVSTLFAAAAAEMKAAIIECHKCALLFAIEYLQEVAGLSRRGEGGTINERAALLWGLFLHYVSQALDPHIHTHAILVNLCIRQDGTTGAIRTIDFFRELKAATAIYETELASQLTTKLGLTIRPLEKGGFEIEGVPRELCQEFSKRRAAMDKEIEARNAKNPKSASYAAKSTRPDKQVVSHEAIFARWQKTTRARGFGEEEAQSLVRPRDTEHQKESEFKSIFSSAIEKTDKSKRASSLLIALGRKLAIAHGASGQEVKDAFRDLVPQKRAFVHIEWKQLFPKAPSWSPATLVKAPVIKIGNPKPYRRWGDILWEKNSNVGKMRVRNGYSFRRLRNGARFTR